MINEEKRKVQLEVLNELEKNNYNGIFILPTGNGKSWILIESLKRLVDKYNYKKILYVCNSTTLRDYDFKKEIIDWGYDYLIDLIEFHCYQTAYKFKDLKFDVVLADEFDYSLTKEYSKLYFNNVFKHKILTTAFIAENKMEIANKIENIIYTKMLNESEDSGALNKSKYFYVNFPLNSKENKEYIKHNKEISACINACKFDTKSKKLQFNLQNSIRKRKQFLGNLESSKEITKLLLKNLEKTNEKVLVFCEFTKQADEICKNSYHYNSDPENLTKFRNNEIKILSVCGKVNRGVNIKDVRHVVFESCNRSKTQMTQRLGRGKRLDVSEYLNVYFLIPYYMSYENNYKPTVVLDWINDSTSHLNINNIETYKFKS